MSASDEFRPIRASLYGQVNQAVNPQTGHIVDVRTCGSSTSGYYTDPNTGQQVQIRTNTNDW